MKLYEHRDFEQAILNAAEYFRPQGLRPAVIEKDYYVTDALRTIAAVAGDKIIFKGGTKRDGTPLGGYARHYYDLFQLATQEEVIALLNSDEYARSTSSDTATSHNFPVFMSEPGAPSRRAIFLADYDQ